MGFDVHSANSRDQIRLGNYHTPPVFNQYKELTYLKWITFKGVLSNLGTVRNCREILRISHMYF